MKTSLASLERLFCGVALTTLAACGGGGGDDPAPTPPAPPPGSATPVPPPPNSPPPPPAPAPTGTGLGNPSLQLTLDARDAVLLARKMEEAGNAAAGAAATLALGPLDPGVQGSASPVACPLAGTLSYATTAPGVYAYTYAGCQVGGYTFNGTSTVTSTLQGGVLQSFTVDFDGLQVAAAGTPASVTGQLRCQAPAAAGQAPACVSSYASFVWGWDTSFTAEGASGTHQCTCSNGSWNVTFDKFTGSAGMAYVYATNGTAAVTRTGVKTFTVVLTVNGVTQAFDIVLN